MTTSGTPSNVMQPLHNLAYRYLDGLISRSEFIQLLAYQLATRIIESEQATVYLAKTLTEGKHGVDQ